MAKTSKKKKPAKKKAEVPALTKEQTIEQAREVVPIILKYMGGTDREGEYFMYRQFGLTQEMAAEMAGYNKNSGARLDARYKESAKLRQKVDNLVNTFADGYRKTLRSWLPQMARIDGAVINEYLANPKLAIDKPQALKQLKQAAGISFEEQVPKQATINIGQLNVLQKMIGDDLDQTIKEGEIVDAELKQIASVSRPGGKR